MEGDGKVGQTISTMCLEEIAKSVTGVDKEKERKMKVKPLSNMCSSQGENILVYLMTETRCDQLLAYSLRSVH